MNERTYIVLLLHLFVVLASFMKSARSEVSEAGIEGSSPPSVCSMSSVTSAGSGLVIPGRSARRPCPWCSVVGAVAASDSIEFVVVWAVMALRHRNRVHLHVACAIYIYDIYLDWRPATYLYPVNGDSVRRCFGVLC